MMNVDNRNSKGHIGKAATLDGRPRGLAQRWRNMMFLADARLRLLLSGEERGAVTAEYAVVLVAATGFGALLVSLLKSDVVKNLLLDIIKKALQLS